MLRNIARRKGFYVRVKSSAMDGLKFVEKLLAATSRTPISWSEFNNLIGKRTPSVQGALTYLKQGGILELSMDDLELRRDIYVALSVLDDEERALIIGEPIAKKYCLRMAEKYQKMLDFAKAWQETIRMPDEWTG